jgi:hypothetical protein
MVGFVSSSVDDENSIWSGEDSYAAIEAAKALYGSNASVAAAWCALAARCDGRTTDYKFWFAIFEKLRPECESACCLHGS